MPCPPPPPCLPAPPSPRVSRPAIVDEGIETSGRRWQAKGFVPTLLINQAMRLGYSCGVDVHTLARLYYSSQAHKATHA